MRLLIKFLFLGCKVFALAYGIAPLNSLAATSPIDSAELSNHSAKELPGYAQSASLSSLTAQAAPFSGTPVNPERTNESPFLQPLPTPLPVPAETEAPILSPADPPTQVPASESPVTVFVQRIEVQGSTVFDEKDFTPLLQPYIGQPLSLEQLQQTADQITQLYLNAGYITSRAVLADQVIENGLVQIQVVEGSVEQVTVEGNRQVTTAYIRDRIQLGLGTPLNQLQLEEQLRLLRLDPLFEEVSATLRPDPSGLGRSLLIVSVVEANPLTATFSADNLSPPSVGSERLGVGLSYRNVSGNGDELSAAYYRSTTGGSNVLDFSYRIPLNPRNGTLQLRVAPSFFRITEANPFNINGNAQTYEVSFRQPLVRSLREEFALTLGFAYRDGAVLIGDQVFNSGQTSVFKFEQDYLRRDPQGVWALRSQFNLGTGLFNADASFFSWVGQVQRVQILSPDNFLIAQADVQLTPNTLVPSQQFLIGGGQSVRGYRQNLLSGDNGLRFSLEDRIALLRNSEGSPSLQLAPFFDMGVVWNNGLSNTRQNFLAGLGLGLLVEPLPRLNLRLDYALPLVASDLRGNNAQDQAFYFSVNYKL